MVFESQVRKNLDAQAAKLPAHAGLTGSGGGLKLLTVGVNGRITDIHSQNG